MNKYKVIVLKAEYNIDGRYWSQQSATVVYSHDEARRLFTDTIVSMLNKEPELYIENSVHNYYHVFLCKNEDIIYSIKITKI